MRLKLRGAVRGSVGGVGRGAALACSAMHFTSLHLVPSLMLQKEMEKRKTKCENIRTRVQGGDFEVTRLGFAPASVVDEEHDVEQRQLQHVARNHGRKICVRGINSAARCTRVPRRASRRHAAVVVRAAKCEFDEP